MPVISYFFGIYVRMYYDDHAPPHFHVEYQGHVALIEIATGDVLEGSIPVRAHRIVREWAVERKMELMDNWQRAQELEPLLRIKGADND